MYIPIAVGNATAPDKVSNSELRQFAPSTERGEVQGEAMNLMHHFQLGGGA
jgi:hypothetical protein